MAAIPVVTVEVGSKVTLAVPPPTHGSPSWPELEVSKGDAARPEAEHPPAGHEIEVVEVPSDGKAGDRVELPAPSQELAVVRSSTGPSSGLGATTDLVWPCPEDPRKVRFILRDEQEVQLWDVLGGEGS